ncbi:hypothetical protein [Roseateles violae]|uniref:DUF4189 domain-containing protein n=1 Tax=Roseateles violae TaxID=3058042 RepID=A0ABT8DRC8_9BURK|nr:hypothetical protein [Pelomonas sp. PFR6]MDN3918857.1 hypothetical protein [Pelomonas sp. PFR6]
MNESIAASRRGKKRWLTCLGLLALGGLALASDAPRGGPASGPASLLPQIKALVGDAACDAPDQCRTIAIGAKSCGGPSAYLAWSVKRTDEAALKALVAKQAAAQQLEDARSGAASDCALVTDPGARCQAGRCVLLPRPAGGGGESAR